LIQAYLNAINLQLCSLWSIRNKHVAWVRLRPSSLSSSWVCCWLLHESSVGNLSLPIYTSVHTLHLVSLSLCLSHSLFSLCLSLSISLSVWSLDMPLPPFQSACERICCHLCIPAIISRHFLSLNERQRVCESVKRYLWSYRNDSLADSVNVGFLSVYMLSLFFTYFEVNYPFTNIATVNLMHFEGNVRLSVFFYVVALQIWISFLHLNLLYRGVWSIFFMFFFCFVLFSSPTLSFKTYWHCTGYLNFSKKKKKKIPS